MSSSRSSSSKTVPAEWFVYVLRARYARDVRYVGCTHSLAKRYYAHLHHRTDLSVSLWVARSLPDIPILQPVAKFSERPPALLFEQRTIERLRRAGASLLNGIQETYIDYIH